MYKEPDDIMGEDKINDIVYRYFKERSDIRDEMQGKIDDLAATNQELLG